MGGEVLNGTAHMHGYDTPHDCTTYEGDPVHLDYCRILLEEQQVNLTDAIQCNRDFFETGPGYLAVEL